MSPSTLKTQSVTDDFVKRHATTSENAKSYVHVGIDPAYHPTGGYWFPADQHFPDSSGCVTERSQIPGGELVQFPCEEKQPLIKGEDKLPTNVVNRTLND